MWRLRERRQRGGGAAASAATVDSHCSCRCCCGCGCCCGLLLFALESEELLRCDLPLRGEVGLHQPVKVAGVLPARADHTEEKHANGT